MKFSIVVPVHNVEQYLAQTVLSVSSQSVSDYEVLLIDDGSTDNSPGLCDDFAQKSRRVRVVHKANGGVSSARNVGIQRAQGDYLLFLDADDLLDNEALNFLSSRIDSSGGPYDVVLGNRSDFSGDVSTTKIRRLQYDMDKIERSDRDEFLHYLFADLKGFHPSVTSHAYRTAFIRESRLYFDEDLTYDEDGDWCLSMLLAAKSRSAISESTYLYRRDTQLSLCNTGWNVTKFLSEYTVDTKWIRFLQHEYSGNQASRDAVIAYLAERYTNLGATVLDLDGVDRRRATECFTANIDVLNLSKRMAHRLLRPVCTLFGVRAYLWLINRLHKLKSRLSLVLRGGVKR